MLQCGWFHWYYFLSFTRNRSYISLTLTVCNTTLTFYHVDDTFCHTTKGFFDSKRRYLTSFSFSPIPCSSHTPVPLTSNVISCPTSRIRNNFFLNNLFSVLPPLLDTLQTLFSQDPVLLSSTFPGLRLGTDPQVLLFLYPSWRRTTLLSPD